MNETVQTAELMNSIYRNQRHFYDLTRKFYLLGRDHLIENLRPPQGSSVLELGCGTGRNLIQAANRYPGVRFHGLDISERMLETAAEKVRKAGLEDRISLIKGDASDPSSVRELGGAPYDRVFFSYTLSMMPIWREALATGLSNLSDDGTILVVDFGQQERLPGWFRSFLLGWLARYHVSPRAELVDELSALAERHDASLSTQSFYRDYALYAELRRG